MTVTEASQDIRATLERAALPVKSGPMWALTIPLLALVVASQVPALLRLEVEERGLISLAAPFLLLVLLLVRAIRTDNKFYKEYGDALLRHTRTEATPANRELAQAIAKERSGMAAPTIWLCLAMFVFLVVSQSVVFWSDRRLSIADLTTAAQSVGNVLLYLMLLAANVLTGLLPATVVRHPKVDFQKLAEELAVSDLALEPSDSNDIEIVGLNVSIQSVHRRVEAYTIESTLLSALSFSAFTAIVYSDSGPVEDIQWILDAPMACLQTVNVCLPVLTASDVQEHLMFIIAACLLMCAVFFLSVLVTRLRFSDALRYTEQLVRTAEVLNQKEESAVDAQRGKLTAEISKLLDRARHGVIDLSPMVTFMKTFRDLGILAFVAAIATCGFYFHPAITLAIAVTFGAAFSFGYIDKLRRRSSLLPRIETTILRWFGSDLLRRSRR